MPSDQALWSMHGAGRSGVSMWTQFVRDRAVEGEAAVAALTEGHDAAMGVPAWLDAVEAGLDGVRAWLP